MYRAPIVLLYALLADKTVKWTPTHGCARVGRPARTYIQQLCEDMGCNPEDPPEAMNDREKWRETVRDIRAGGATWWWYIFKNLTLWKMCCLGLSRVYVGGEGKHSFKILFRDGLVGLISHSCILFQTSSLLSSVIFVCLLPLVAIFSPVLYVF